jgi:hypothetical protein
MDIQDTRAKLGQYRQMPALGGQSGPLQLPGGED